ncbi:arginyltransferase [Ketogulonicigenium vulgare]|uniref:Aspartate/glutamate leucyltransferase n=1 Tax=Ketogulonicigenium vulgare (strain WSH-001) TaxID=759362 RepID=F9Y485_KETVW|nr:arginyltransferase [Ketogulonicigenium vulgare]ADO42329.1 arginyl-tRNA-protein transferase [Ketogulonicigenium vulgare Y25]AEM40521.1 Arginine-tRNA-protein transferase, putative [Ketogulonicigenium vulgare WSH-001]ALJ80708.1 arginyl-tRNA--protein transferase [Ketogulonicigenium vulgare]ANW33512.1 arginyltransferase [Ketogulonicigenium vulgare]AOZ54240.1 arginyl-tRNA-protein transferase [Ketogulonicigenium vulgare]
MRHSLPLAPQFYVTAPAPCPYLEGQLERKLFTALQGDGAAAMNDALSKQGFRRSQNVIYRPTCANCSACLSARIRVADFKPNAWQRRVLKRNARVQRRVRPTWATEDQFALFRRYLDARHEEGGMADMDVFEFAAMVEQTPVRSRMVEFTDPEAADFLRDDDGLVGACLIDILDDGLSLVYSFYDPNRPSDSLGNYIILQHILLAQELGLPYVYLGYWVPGSPKMAYKARYQPLEIYRGGAWVQFDPQDPPQTAPHPLDTPPVAEQVARITLPDLTRL